MVLKIFSDILFTSPVSDINSASFIGNEEYKWIQNWPIFRRPIFYYRQKFYPSL